MSSGRDNVEELVRASEGWLNSTFGDISRTTPTKQIAIGGASGWCCGYVAMKVGKLASFAVGGSILTLLIASQKGYIKINWNQVNRDIDEATRALGDQSTSSEVSSLVSRLENTVERKAQKAKRYVEKKLRKDKVNVEGIGILCAAFTGGLLAGVGTSHFI